MISNKFLGLGVFLGLLGLAVATGKQGYGEECSIAAGITNFFTKDADDNPKACNAEKKLICANTCICIPGHTYDKSGILSVFTGGKCLRSPSFPCTGDDTECVANAACTNDNISICKCHEGYHSKDGLCTNGSGKNVLNGLYIATLLSSYFLLSY